ncbi:MAG: ImmA/IrrE family metallo-endopeptidase [Bacteroidota bacterium]
MKNGKSGLLPYGFKAKAERTAIDFRKKMNLKPHDPLSAFDLADHLEIPVFTPVESGLTKSEANNLMKDGSGWWGLTMKNSDGHYVIIYNTYQSSTRQQSTLMHELSHIICQHELPEPKIILDHPLPMRTYDPNLEEEANCLGGTLQITRTGLLWALKKEMTVGQISDHFLASEAMVTFRINTTAVNRQIGFTKKCLIK